MNKPLIHVDAKSIFAFDQSDTVFDIAQLLLLLCLRVNYKIYLLIICKRVAFFPTYSS